MPIAEFQPVIGSSFDAVTGQQFGWTQANRQQEEANIGREQQALRDYNRWLGETAQMNRADTYAQQAREREDFQISATQKGIARREAEARRQFEASLEFSKQANKEAIQAKKDQFEMQLKLDKAQETKQNQVLENFGQNYVETLQNAAAQREEVTQEYQNAMNDVMTFGQKKVSELGIPGLTFNAQQRKIVVADPRNTPIDPKDWPRITSANEEIAQREAAYAGVHAKMAVVERSWQDVLKPIKDYQFIVKGEGRNVYLHSPALGKSFGQMVKEAGGKVPEPTRAEQEAWVTSLVGGRPGGEPEGFVVPAASGQTQTATAPAAFSPVQPTPSPGPVVAPALQPTPTPAPIIADTGVQAQTDTRNFAAPEFTPLPTMPSMARPDAPVDRFWTGVRVPPAVPPQAPVLPPVSLPPVARLQEKSRGTTILQPYSNPLHTPGWTPTQPPSDSATLKFPPAPENPADRVFGKIYMRPNGPAQWQQYTYSVGGDQSSQGKPGWKPVTESQLLAAKAGQKIAGDFRKVWSGLKEAAVPAAPQIDPKIDALRQQAFKAINSGKDPRLVAERFQQLTGMPLQ